MDPENNPKPTKRECLRLLADVCTNRAPLQSIDTCVKAGADVNGSVQNGLRPLHYAVYENYVRATNKLIQLGADVNAADDCGYTPLHIASKHGSLECCRSLILHEAVVNFADQAGDSASARLSKALDELTVNPLSLAVENNHAEVVELLLQNGADPNHEYFLGTELTLAPLENLSSIRLLLRYGANPDSFNRGGLTALMKACKHQKADAVRVLLRYGANVNAQCPPKFDQKRAIHFAAMNGNVDILKQLLQNGAYTTTPPNFPYGPLDFAVTQDKVVSCKILLDYGADANEVNGAGCSPLQVVCSTVGLKKQKEILNVLLENGAKPNFYSEFFSYMEASLSPIVEYFAYQEEYDINVVKLLIQYGATVNFTVPTRLLKIKDPFGMLVQLRKLRPHEDIFLFLMEAATAYDYYAIKRESSLSNHQKELLLEAASTPRNLKHQCRLAIRRLVTLPIVSNLKELPVPTYISNYLLFEVY